MNVTVTWYPIETVPLDGRDVLLYCAKWRRTVMIACPKDLADSMRVAQNYDDLNLPTHWMHLPEAP